MKQLEGERYGRTRREIDIGAVAKNSAGGHTKRGRMYGQRRHPYAAAEAVHREDRARNRIAEPQDGRIAALM
jgi:hypothetical protein